MTCSLEGFRAIYIECAAYNISKTKNRKKERKTEESENAYDDLPAPKDSPKSKHFSMIENRKSNKSSHWTIWKQRIFGMFAQNVT